MDDLKHADAARYVGMRDEARHGENVCSMPPGDGGGK